MRTDKRGWRRGGRSAQLFHYFHYWQRPRREVKRVRSGEVGGGGTTEREADWELVTQSARSAGQTGADRANVFLLRCAELLNRQQEERPASISLPDRLWMNQSLCGQLGFCVRVCESVFLKKLKTLNTVAKYPLWKSRRTTSK